MIEELDLPAVDSARKRIVEATDGGQHLTVSGPVGSGQRTLARQLAETNDAAVIELPDIRDADATAHIVYKLSRYAQISVDEAQPIEEALQTALGKLHNLVRLVIQIPRTWSLDGTAQDPERNSFERRASRALTALTKQSRVAIVFMGPHPERLRLSHLPHEVLPRATISARVLRRPQMWGSFSSAADELAKHVPETLELHPVRLRLAVGVVALDAQPVDRVAAELSVHGQLDVFVRDIVRASTSRPLLWDALWRFALLRVPLPRSSFVECIDPPAEHEALFTSCLGYGNNLIRTNSTIRTALRIALHKEARAAGRYKDVRKQLFKGHEKLAKTHQELDGQLDPNATTASSITHWMEKVHHLANGGASCKADWLKQGHLRPEMLWNRARSLSRSGDYEAAVKIYERCVELDKQDDYAWHYLAYNLDKAGNASERTERAFRVARNKEPANAWWNSRLVTYLIGQARYTDAQKAWQSAVRDVTDSGAELISRPELARHLHRWVVSAWLGIGDVKRAREVFDEIPNAAREQLWELETQLVDAEEAVLLGESVRPPEVPAGSRWERLTPLETKGLVAWYPARVRSYTKSSVELVVATTAPDPGARQIYRKDISRKKWKAACRLPPRKDLFVEIGEYSKGKLIIIPIAAPVFGNPGIRKSELRHLEKRDRDAKTR